MTDEGQIDGTTHYEKDGSGNIIHNPDEAQPNSLGHNIQTPTDVSGSRSFGTEYQNSTAYVRLVHVQIENATGSGGGFDADLSVGNTSGGTKIVDKIKTSSNDGDILTLGPIFVPPNGYYRARSFGVESMFAWFEADYQ